MMRESAPMDCSLFLKALLRLPGGQARVIQGFCQVFESYDAYNGTSL